MMGRGRQFSEFLYVFVGSFVGGGVVLDGKVFTGRSGNSGALGPLPVPNGQGGATQLLNLASLNTLEKELMASGWPTDVLGSNPNDWTGFEPQLTIWIDQTASALALAITAAASVIDIEAAIIDGAFPEDIRQRLVECTSARLEEIDLTGLEPPLVLEASVGRSARSMGAALLPIRANYFLA
jgi:predicted NBD/HSP70 family sugar kinase